MKENLNIQFLLFKYVVFFLIYASFTFSYQILHSLFLFSFLLNVIIRLFRIFESTKYHLWMSMKGFIIITTNFFTNAVHLGNSHRLLWFLLLIIKHQRWQPYNFISKPSFWLTLTNWWQKDRWDLKVGPELYYDEILQKHLNV